MHIATVGQLPVPVLVLLLLLFHPFFLGLSRAATILHSPQVGQPASAISHQSFVRLSKSPPLILATPTVRIVNAKPSSSAEAAQVQIPVQQELHQHTPAHLTYAAHPVVHQMLPRIKPVRNISFASLRLQPAGAGTHAQANVLLPHTQLKFV